MTYCSQLDIESLAATASRAAAYIDDCDNGAREVRLDPNYYQACSNVLIQIFKVCNAQHDFPMLLEHSAAAREVDQALRIEQQINSDLAAHCPELEAILRRNAR